ncbi:MAG TPA: orotidine-5'-phosphate decarboxylase [Dehalococcoidia bacterium]|nr:orotidine-5'-phosphate decarboxylase [Dehalococcoidia bacterium]
MRFLEKLEAAVERNDSLLCVGLDPDPALMAIEDVAAFNRAIIEATSDLVCCYKPNLAFYEALGGEGWDALRATMAAVPAHIPVIADAKRGDIGNTAAAYARAIFDVLGADAMTVNCYGGRDSMEPFLEREDRGVLVWCRSSNPGAGDLQDLEVSFGPDRQPLWQVVALRARAWNTRGNVGLVVGATYPVQLAQARALCPDMPVLVPGVGAQEGAVGEAVRAGLDARGRGIIVSASRGVTYASRGRDFAEAAREAALKLRDEINGHRRAGTASGG